MVITTKSQEKVRMTAPAGEDTKAPEAPAAEKWSKDDKGNYSGAGKHYGDNQPKVFAPSVGEAVALVKEVDPTAKASGEKAPISVSSKLDTLNTNIVEVDGRIVISGPLAGLVAQHRGLQLLTAGEGNPSVVEE